ncbi:MAG TPA: hypothetical protein PKY87_15230 [Terricaulis sp.]|nr:hypothetical protein [Terricaulis sp.]
MIKRALVFAVAVTLAACAPPPQEAEPQSVAEAPAAEAAPEPNPEAARLEGNLIPGYAWTYWEADGQKGANFEDASNHPLVRIVCTTATRAIGVEYEFTHPYGRPTTISLITATQTINIPAEGLEGPIDLVVGELAGADPSWVGLTRPQERFGIVVAAMPNVIGRMPWEARIAETLAPCRA